MKPITSAFWIILCVFLYQNCGESPATKNMTNTNDYKLNSSELGTINLAKPIVSHAQGNGFELDLTSGVILSADNDDWIGFCLSESKRDQIFSYLEYNSVCETQNQYPPDILCAMVYTKPYLEIYVAQHKERTKLGEGESTCPKRSLSLCKNDQRVREIFNSLVFTDDFTQCQ